MLTDEERRSLEATLLDQFKSALIATEELADGYFFRIPDAKKWLVAAAKLIATERECCPFLRLELIAEPEMGPIAARMTGPVDVKRVPELDTTRRQFVKRGLGKMTTCRLANS